MKPLFITIDTEGDALWDNPEVVMTDNSLFIPRFQELCEKYGFIPIWLTDYEMANDSRFMDYIVPKARKGLCEIGMHLHAKNNPPIVQLEKEEAGAAFLIEYSKEIMRKKIRVLKNLLEEKVGMPVVSHRAGRWALNQIYIDLLIEEGIKFDCSVTPGIDWSGYNGITPGSKGANYAKSMVDIHTLEHSNKKGILTEIPMTISSYRKFVSPKTVHIRDYARMVHHYIKGTPIWLRSGIRNLEEMKYIIHENDLVGKKFAEYMIHSSELMPGANPTFKTQKDIEVMYTDLSKLFQYSYENGYRGATFSSWFCENKE